MTNAPEQPVERVDREAAADLGRAIGWADSVIDAARKGEVDYWPTLQAFARHRLTQTTLLREAREALEQAQDSLCTAYCGHSELRESVEHRPECLKASSVVVRLTAALDQRSDKQGEVE